MSQYVDPVRTILFHAKPCMQRENDGTISSSQEKDKECLLSVVCHGRPQLVLQGLQDGLDVVITLGWLSFLSPSIFTRHPYIFQSTYLSLFILGSMSVYLDGNQEFNVSKRRT